eukprot:TRINITY_DN17835_c0_g3_i1.p1 TRINITY_DN17835_c0_g3~~TRINITY_DN17835_c0_g3_i1.p1  ORF type:complete len:1677 (+),score=396.64 TRINITY_DN17835_c0_g3_i1:125-5155(+)
MASDRINASSARCDLGGGVGECVGLRGVGRGALGAVFRGSSSAPGAAASAEEVERWLGALAAACSDATASARPLRSLAVSRCALTDAAVAPLAAALAGNAPGGVAAAAPLLPRVFGKLCYLDLSGNSLTDACCAALARGCGTLRGSSSADADAAAATPGGLRALVLSGNQIGAGGAEALANAFFAGDDAAVGSASPRLLALSGNPLGDNGVAALAAVLQRRPQTCCLAALQLCDVGCGSIGCSALARAVPRLAALDVGHNAIPLGRLLELIRAVAQPLSRLRLANVVSGGGGLFRTPASQTLASALTERVSSLAELGVASNELKDEGVKPLLESLAVSPKPVLEVLDLKGNRLREGTGNLLAKLLAGPGGVRLRTLVLEANELGDLALAALSAGIAVSAPLRRLRLARNRFGDAGVEALAQALRHQARGAAAAAAAASSILQDAWLERIYSVGGETGDASAVSASGTWGCVSEELEDEEEMYAELGVREVDISFNMVTDEGAISLADVACSNGAMTQLNLYSTSVGDAGRAALKDAVQASYTRVQSAAGLVLGCADISGAPTARRPSRLPMPLFVQGLDIEDYCNSFTEQLRAWVEKIQHRDGTDTSLQVIVPLETQEHEFVNSGACEQPSRVSEAATVDEHRQQGQTASVASPDVQTSFAQLCVPLPLEAQAGLCATVADGDASPGDTPQTAGRRDAVARVAAAELLRGATPLASVVEHSPPVAQVHGGRCVLATASPPLSVAESHASSESTATARRGLGLLLQRTKHKLGKSVVFEADIANIKDVTAAQETFVPSASSSSPPVLYTVPRGHLSPRLLSGGQHETERLESLPLTPLPFASLHGNVASSAAGTNPKTSAGVTPPSEFARSPSEGSGQATAALGSLIGRARRSLKGTDVGSPSQQEQQITEKSSEKQNHAFAPQVQHHVQSVFPPEQVMNDGMHAFQPVVQTQKDVSMEEKDKDLLRWQLGNQAQFDLDEYYLGSAAVDQPQQQSMHAPREQFPKQPLAEEPEGEQPTIPDRTVRLEREVAELRQDVCRIDRTVSATLRGSSHEPEQEADVPDRIVDAGNSTAPQPVKATQSECAGPAAAQDATAAAAPESDVASAAAAAEPKAAAAAAGAASGAPPPPKGKGKAKGAAAPPLPPAKGRGKGAAPPPPPPRAGGGPGGAAAGAGGKGGGGASASAQAAKSAAPFARKLYWKPLDLADSEGTIFGSEARDTEQDQLQLDTTALKRMFEGEKAKDTESQRRSTTVLNRAQQKTTGLKLLSDDRARNVAIVLRRLPCSVKELTGILRDLAWESAAVSTDDMEQILDVIPTLEEANKLRQHRAPEARKALRDVEQMVLPLALLSRASARVRIVCVARNARREYGNTMRALHKLRSACDAIHRSRALRKVMLLALDLGNFINHGDSSKGAKAISIGSLLTLRDFKAGRNTALHFLCATLLRENPERDVAATLAQELAPVSKAVQECQLQTVQSQVRSFSRDYEVANAECKNFSQEYDGRSNNSKARARTESSDGLLLDENRPEGEDEEDVEEEEEPPFEDLQASPSHAELAASEAQEEEGATRFVEDVMKIRGSPRMRLRCMRRVLEKLKGLLLADYEKTVLQTQQTLLFCGVVAKRTSKDLPADLEPMLEQLKNFVSMFREVWEEVRADLPQYLQLFSGGDGASPLGNAQR